MKQTVTILTALMVALLLISGFSVLGSMQQGDMLARREDQLLKQSQTLDEKTLLAETLEAETAEQAKQLEQLTKERDALSLQLNDAVLSSQESNDALAQREKELQKLQMEKEQLSKQLLDERKQAQELRTQLAACQEEVSAATLYEPAPTPTAFRVERKVK